LLKSKQEIEQYGTNSKLHTISKPTSTHALTQGRSYLLPRGSFGYLNKYFFSLTKLVYFDISYPNNIYLATAEEFICHKSVEIGKLEYIHLFNRYIPYYFDTFLSLKQL